MTDSRNDIGAPFPQRKQRSMSDELVEAAFTQLTEQGYLPNHRIDRRAAAIVVIDAVEPLIRADEQDKCYRLFRATRDRDLRAKVEALPEGAERRWDGDDALIWRSDVLALLDGSE